MTIKNRERLAEKSVEKLIAWDRPDLDKKDIDQFIKENYRDYRNLVNIFNWLTSFGIIYTLFLLIHGAVIIPTIIPGLSWIQNLAIVLPAIITIPIFPLLYWKCVPKYRTFRKKLNNYKR